MQFVDSFFWYAMKSLLQGNYQNLYVLLFTPDSLKIPICITDKKSFCDIVYSAKEFDDYLKDLYSVLSISPDEKVSEFYFKKI